MRRRAASHRSPVVGAQASTPARSCPTRSIAACDPTVRPCSLRSTAKTGASRFSRPYSWGGRGAERAATCGGHGSEVSSSPAAHRRRARTARCGRSPADSGRRSAARCGGRHSCNNPGRGATPRAARPRGCTVTGSPATRRRSATWRGAAPVPANAPPAPPRQALRRPPAASPPNSGTGGRPAPVPATRCAGRRRTAARRHKLRGPGHRPRPRPGHRRRLSFAASPPKQSDRRRPAPPRAMCHRVRPAHGSSPPKRRARRCSVSPRVARCLARSPRASPPNQCGGQFPAPPLTSCCYDRLSYAAPPPKRPARPAAPWATCHRVRPAHGASSAKRCARRCSVSPQVARCLARRPRASPPNQSGAQFPAPPPTVVLLRSALVSTPLHESEAAAVLRLRRPLRRAK